MIILIAPVVSNIVKRRSGRFYGNTTQTIADDPGDWDDLDLPDRTQNFSSNLWSVRSWLIETLSKRRQRKNRQTRTWNNNNNNNNNNELYFRVNCHSINRTPQGNEINPYQIVGWFLRRRGKPEYLPGEKSLGVESLHLKNQSHSFWGLDTCISHLLVAPAHEKLF